MDAQEVRNRVRTVVFDMAPLRESEAVPGSLLREELGYDSLSLLQLAVALEDEFRLLDSAELDTEVAETILEVENIVLAKIQALDG